jgi:hypothetical protein
MLRVLFLVFIVIFTRILSKACGFAKQHHYFFLFSFLSTSHKNYWAYKRVKIRKGEIMSEEVSFYPKGKKRNKNCLTYSAWSLCPPI